MKITKQCLHCNADFTIPPCRDWREHCCSPQCKAAHSGQILADSIFARVRTCATCDGIFVPRQVQIDAGGGRFCSKVCGIKSNQHLLHAPAVKQSRADAIRRGYAEGRIIPRVGPENAQWTGGKAASIERAKPFMAAKLRAYRKANPHKVKEFSQKRRGLKTGKLPRGTVARIFELQRKKCAICRCSIVGGYHADHITAISKGGAHVPTNIQLLCATCNVRKSAKDPIDFMQSRGYLL